MGYTACFEPAMLLTNTRQAHMEMGDTPIVDKAAYVMLGSDDFLLRLMAEQAEQATSRGACPHELGLVAHKTAGSGFERRTLAQRAKARGAFVNECSRSTSSSAPSAAAP